MMSKILRRATAIGARVLVYDNNGNLTGTTGSSTSTLGWDYLNRLASYVASGTTSTYAYDPSNERIKAAITTGTSTVTTVYPTKFYNVTAGIPTKHVFANGVAIATIIGTGATSTVSSVLADHLTGSGVVTNASGTIIELSDYYPYGGIRIDDKTGFNEQRKFAGHEYDGSTGLSYMRARYQNGSWGKFISQDPAFNAVGSLDLEGKAGMSLQQYLIDPQLSNSYSYAKNSPLVYIDKTGNNPAAILLLPLLAYGPQISTFAQSYLAPMGQFDLMQATQDTQEGRYGWAAFGLMTAGEVPMVKIGASAQDIKKIYQQTNAAGRTLMEGIDDLKVLNLIKDNYRAGSKIGNGSTADAVRYELEHLGEAVGGKLHEIKAQETINRINNMFKNYGSELNSQAKKVMQGISDDLKSALEGKK